MNILAMHNRYLLRGGEDESYEAEIQLLRSRGNTVEEFVEDNQRISELGALKSGLRTLWSRETYRAVRERIQTAKHHLVHVHNFFPLISPAVYYATEAERLPVVQTLHNYRLLCPNGLFFRDGHVCEECMGHALSLPAVVHACYRNSVGASMTVSSMLSLHRAAGTFTNRVSVYIALTHFAKNKFIEGGLPADKIVVKPNFVHPDPQSGKGAGGYALYVGRLSEEKGIKTLIRAWESLKVQYPLKIVGKGPLDDFVRDAALRISNLEWLGALDLTGVYQLMGEATFVIVPSECYETFGRVVIESLAKGTPVICSDIGALSELVEEERTGLRFRPGDPEQLNAQVEWALSNPNRLASMRGEARNQFLNHFTAERNYEQLSEIYERASACG